MAKLSKTGLPLCPTCDRLESQHTNPMAHRFGEPGEPQVLVEESGSILVTLIHGGVKYSASGAPQAWESVNIVTRRLKEEVMLAAKRGAVTE